MNEEKSAPEQEAPLTDDLLVAYRRAHLAEATLRKFFAEAGEATAGFSIVSLEAVP